MSPSTEVASSVAAASSAASALHCRYQANDRHASNGIPKHTSNPSVAFKVAKPRPQGPLLLAASAATMPATTGLKLRPSGLVRSIGAGCAVGFTVGVVTPGVCPFHIRSTLPSPPACSVLADQIEALPSVNEIDIGRVIGVGWNAAARRHQRPSKIANAGRAAIHHLRVGQHQIAAAVEGEPAATEARAADQRPNIVNNYDMALDAAVAAGKSNRMERNRLRGGELEGHRRSCARHAYQDVVAILPDLQHSQIIRSCPEVNDLIGSFSANQRTSNWAKIHCAFAQLCLHNFFGC